MRFPAPFQIISNLFARGLISSEIANIDTMPESHRSNPLSSNPRKIGKAGIALIKQFESCAHKRPDGLIEAYPDPGTGGAPWTIGWGSTGKGIGPATVWTQQQCDARLANDLIRYATEVAEAIGISPTTQNQFDALTSFHYNTGSIGRATLTRMHCTGNFAGAAKEFARWNQAQGKVLKGLVRRRAAEAKLYLRSLH
ncbi:lysozyme [Altericroceibacterium spongiae]|uniref:Lysozyme n=1 Tax=Altericroceibacterium spongiae TaxID=2320269 RepID=A0A420EMT2_9SPHN|nr:lysozyme [Altericroceibacterium spongiae]RKF21963.1 lysozyme [Altericroceibacterium spongiae]